MGIQGLNMNDLGNMPGMPAGFPGLDPQFPNQAPPGLNLQPAMPAEQLQQNGYQQPQPYQQAAVPQQYQQAQPQIYPHQQPQQNFAPAMDQGQGQGFPPPSYDATPYTVGEIPPVPEEPKKPARRRSNPKPADAAMEINAAGSEEEEGSGTYEGLVVDITLRNFPVERLTNLKRLLNQ